MSTQASSTAEANESKDSGSAGRLAIICVVAFAIVNLAFYLMSTSYFRGQTEMVPGVGSVPRYAAAQMLAVRGAFALTTGVLALASFAVGRAPRVFGHAIAALLGAIHVVAGIAALAGGVTVAFGVAVLAAGGITLVLVRASLNHSRAAWAFLVAITAVFAVAEVFGAPKIRGALGVGLWTTMLLPGLNFVAAVALAQIRNQYDDVVAARAIPATSRG